MGGSAAVVAWGARDGQAAKPFRVSSALASALLKVGIAGELFPWRPTQNDPDVLDSSSQIGEHGCVCEKRAWEK
jgi:hypothetical protein